MSTSSDLVLSVDCDRCGGDSFALARVEIPAAEARLHHPGDVDREVVIHSDGGMAHRYFVTVDCCGIMI